MLLVAAGLRHAEALRTSAQVRQAVAVADIRRERLRLHRRAPSPTAEPGILPGGYRVQTASAPEVSRQVRAARYRPFDEPRAGSTAGGTRGTPAATAPPT